MHKGDEESRKNELVAEQLILENYRPVEQGVVKVSNGMRLINKDKQHQCVLQIHETGKLNAKTVLKAKQALGEYRSKSGKRVLKNDYICVEQNMNKMYLIRRVPNRSKYQSLSKMVGKINEEQQIKTILLGTLEALTELHAAGLPHNNITLETVRVSIRDSVKIDPPLPLAIIRCQKKRHSLKQSIYAAPQISQNSVRGSLEADIWALGIVFLQLVLMKDLESLKQDPKWQMKVIDEAKKVPLFRRLFVYLLSVNPRDRSNLQFWKEWVINKENKILLYSQQKFMIAILRLSLYSPIRKMQGSRTYKLFDQKNEFKQLKQKKIVINIDHNRIYVTLLTDDMMMITGKTPFNKNFCFSVKQSCLELECRPFLTITDLFKLLGKGKGYEFKWTKDGQLKILISQHYLQEARKMTLKRLGESKYELSLFNVSQFTGSITNNLGYSTKGFLIEKNLILTVAHVLHTKYSNTQINHLYFGIPNNRFKAQSLSFFSTEESKEDSDLSESKHNYGLAIVNNPIHLHNYPTLIQDYSEQAIQRRIEVLQIEASFHYQVGNRFFLKGQLDIKQGQVTLPEEVQEGLPIMIRFSSCRLGCIGMTTNRKQGILFTSHVINRILSWVEEGQAFQEANLFHNYELRIMTPQNFPIDKPELPSYMSTVLKFSSQASLVDEASDKEQAYEHDFVSTLKKNMYLTAALESQEMAFRFTHLPKKILCLKRAMSILDHVLGEDNVKRGMIWYVMGVFYAQEDRKQDAYQCFEQACIAEQTYGFNPLLMARVYFQLGLNNAHFGSYKASASYYQMAEERCRLYHSYCLLSKTLHNRANSLRQMKKWDLSEPTLLLEEAVQLKRRYSSTEDLLTSLRGLASMLSATQNYGQALRTCAEAVELVLKGGVQMAQQKKEILGLWQSVINNSLSQIFEDPDLQALIHRTNQLCINNENDV